MKPVNCNFQKVLCTKDDHEIINFLTDNKVPFGSDKTDTVVAFRKDWDFYVVIKFTKVGDGGFVMFKIEQIRSNLGELTNLKNMLKQVAERGKSACGIWHKACALVENLSDGGEIVQMMDAQK